MNSLKLREHGTSGDIVTSINGKKGVVTIEVGEPENYLKTITKAGSTVTIKDQDNNETSFTTGGGGGGVTLYQHNLNFESYEDYRNYFGWMAIITSSSAPMTWRDIESYFMSIDGSSVIGGGICRKGPITNDVEFIYLAESMGGTPAFCASGGAGASSLLVQENDFLVDNVIELN